TRQGEIEIIAVRLRINLVAHHDRCGSDRSQSVGSALGRARRVRTDETGSVRVTDEKRSLAVRAPQIVSYPGQPVAEMIVRCGRHNLDEAGAGAEIACRGRAGIIKANDLAAAAEAHPEIALGIEGGRVRQLRIVPRKWAAGLAGERVRGGVAAHGERSAEIE